MLEKFLTLPKEVFDKYLRSKPKSSLPERDGKRDAFRFTKVGFCEREELGSSLIKRILDEQFHHAFTARLS